MKLLTVTQGPTWPGNAPLPEVGTSVGSVIFRPVSRVASGTGTTIGESIARLVVAAGGTVELRGTDSAPFRLWGGVPADGSVEAPIYDVEEYLHLYVGTPQERAAVQYFRIQPYETVGDGIPEGTWDYRTVPENAVRYVAGPEVLQAFEEIRGGRVILADAEAARLALLDAADGFASLTAQVQPALDEMAQATDTVLDQAAQATADALAVAGINPAYVSETTADPPAAPDGTKGAKRLADGSFQRLMRVANAWVTAGAALLTLGSLPSIDVRTRAISPTATAAWNAAQMQLLIDNAPDNSRIVGPPADYGFGSTTLYSSAQKNLLFDLPGVTFSWAGSRIGMLIHGGTFDRTLTGAAWSAQFLEKPYEGATYASKVIIRGLTTRSANGVRTGTNIFFYFAQHSGVEYVDINDSDGGGVELRQSVSCFGRHLRGNGIGNYGVFFYQSYGCTLEDFEFKNVARAWEIKQRHKDFATLGHRIRRGRVEDATGFPAPLALQTGTPQTPNPGWITSAVSYNDLVRKGESAAAQAHRNFPGHEISLDVEIEDVTFAVTPGAHAAISAPSLHIGAYARGWTFRRIVCDAARRSSLTSGLQSGDLGDFAFGGTLGGGLVYEDCRWINYNNADNARPFVSYGVGTTLRRCYVHGTMRLVIAQASPAATYVPGGTVDKLQIEDCEGDVNLVMGAIGEQGIRIRAETQLYVGRRNRWRFTPVNDPLSNTNATSNPYYISAARVDIDTDEYTLGLNAAATNHTSTFGYLTTPAGIVKDMRTTFSAPTNVRGMVVTNGSSNALTIDGGSHTLGNAPTGEKTGLRLDNEVLFRRSPELLGGALLQDNTAKNAVVRPYRVTYGTAVPTTGTYIAGDRRRNIAPPLGGVAEWICITGGTPGIWQDSSKLTVTTDPPQLYGTAVPTTGTYVTGTILWRNGGYSLGINRGWVCRTGGGPGVAVWEAFGQAGIRQSTGRPTYAPFFLGEVAYDSLYKVFWRAKGTAVADWMPETAPPAASITWDAPSVSANGVVSTTLTITPATLGDFIDVSCDSLRTPGILMDAQVNKSDNTSGNITLTLYNITGAAIDPPTRNYYFAVRPRA